MEKMNAHTGIANADPDARIPRRCNPEISTMTPRENHTGCSPTNGIADPILATPAAVDTATVRT